MKQNIMRKDIISIVGGVFCAGVIFLASCTKQDHFYKEFMVERTYIGKPDSIWIQPGEYRMQVGWLTPQDSEAKDLIIRWSNSDSLVIPIDHDQETQSIIIPNLEERDYVFNAYTIDGKGNRSLNMELNAPVFGDEYRNTLVERALSHSVIFPTDSIGFVFGGTGQLQTLYGTEVEYTDNEGVKQKVIMRATSTIGVIYDVDPNQEITVRTAYRPHPNAFEYFYFESEPVEVDLVETKRNTLTFGSTGYLDGIYVDFNFVRGFLIADIPRPTGKDIDMAYALGSGSRGNLFTIDGNGFSAFAAAWQSQIAQWPIRNAARMKRSTLAVYDALDENNRDQMIAAYESETSAVADRLSNMALDQVVLLHSEDRDLYIAMKVIRTPPAVSGALGDFTIEFKISRP